MEENEQMEHAMNPMGDMGKSIQRDPPEPGPARAALVSQLRERIVEAKTHWKPQFDRMRKNQRFVHGKQWPDASGSNDPNRYVVNLALSHINQRVSAIYAKNPRVVGKAKNRMWFSVWDGKTESWQAAQQAVEASSQQGLPPPPQVVALIEDIKQGMIRKEQVERIAKTTEKLVQYYFDEPIPRLKKQLKQFVRRIDTCGVAFMKLGYQRAYEANPTITQSIADCSQQIEEVERMLADRADGKIMDGTAELDELKNTLATLQAQEYLLVREGPVFTFPKSWQIIPDMGCTNVATLENCRWLAEEWLLTPDQIKRHYDKDIGTAYTRHGPYGDKKREDKAEKLAAVWIYYDLEKHVCYHLVDGYADFLKEPGLPDIKLEQFHPIFPLAFNELEDDEDPYPPAELDIIRHACLEVNRARDEFVQQRISNRPGYVVVNGTFAEQDKMKLATHANSEVVELDGLAPGVDIKTVIQAKPTMAVDPAIYDDQAFFGDIQRSRQTQEANFGGTGGNTATESTIAEAGRVSGIQSNIDDLDDWLTDAVRATGQVCLLEMSAETVKKLVGDGAMWPELSREEIAAEVYLDIKAGSTGRPNKSLKIANMERLMPFALQTGEISPKWLAGQIVREMDDTVDEDEAMLSGALPIIAMARMMQPSTGDAATDPAQQGGPTGPAQPRANSHGQEQMGIGAVQQGIDQSATPGISG